MECDDEATFISHNCDYLATAAAAVAQMRLVVIDDVRAVGRWGGREKGPDIVAEGVAEVPGAAHHGELPRGPVEDGLALLAEGAVEPRILVVNDVAYEEDVGGHSVVDDDGGAPHVAHHVRRGVRGVGHDELVHHLQPKPRGRAVDGSPRCRHHAQLVHAELLLQVVL